MCQGIQAGDSGECNAAVRFLLDTSAVMFPNKEYNWYTETGAA